MSKLEHEEQGFHILVVDDDEIDIMYVQRELSKLEIPFSLHVAHDGVEALDKLCGTSNEAPILQPKIIILDLMMPKMNGLEFLKTYRELFPNNNITIYILTTSNNELDKKATRDLKVDGYFVKDTEFKNFISHCKNILEQSTRF